jgi:hypothetical protein
VISQVGSSPRDYSLPHPDAITNNASSAFMIDLEKAPTTTGGYLERRDPRPRRDRSNLFF